MLLLVTMAILFYLASRVEFSHVNWLSDDNEYSKRSDKFDEEFGISDDNLLLVVELKDDSDLYSSDVVAAVDDLDIQIRSLSSVKKSTNLLSLKAFAKGEVINLSSIGELISSGKISLSDFKNLVKKNSYYRQYVSADSKFLLYEIELNPCERCSDEFQQIVDIERFIDARIKNHKSIFFDYFLIGKSIIEHQAQQDTKFETCYLLISSILILFIVSTLICRSFLGALIVITTVINAVLVTISLFVIFDLKFNAVDSILLLLIVIISICDATYILSYWRYDMRKLKKIKLSDTIKHSFIPCLLTSVTSSAGFATFYFSALYPFQTLSLVAIPAILLAFIVIIGNMFLLLYIFERPLQRNFRIKAVLGRKSYISIVLHFLTHFSKNNSQIISNIAIFVIVSAFMVAGYKSFTIEADPIHNVLSSKTGLYENLNKFNSIFGSNEIELHLAMEEEEFYNYDNYKKIRDVADKASQLGSLSTISMRDVVLIPFQQLRNSEKEISSQSDLSQSLLFIELGEKNAGDTILSKVVNFDYSQVRIRINSSDDTISLFQEIKSQMAESFYAVNDVFGSIGVRIYLSHEMITTLSVGVLVTLLFCFSLLYCSYGFRLSLIGILINIFTILLLLSLLTLFDQKVGYGVVLAIVVGVGMNIDFTIHILNICFKMYKSANGDFSILQRHISHLMEVIGRPIISIATIMFCGDLMFSISEIELLRDFGISSMIMLVISVVLHLVLMPILTFSVQSNMVPNHNQNLN